MTLRQCYRESGLSSSQQPAATNISACVSLCHLISPFSIPKSQFSILNGFAYDSKKIDLGTILSISFYLVLNIPSTIPLWTLDSGLLLRLNQIEPICFDCRSLPSLLVFIDDLIGIEREIVAWFGPLACGVLPFLASLRTTFNFFLR